MAPTPRSPNRNRKSPRVFPELTDPSWRAVVEREAAKPYFRGLMGYLKAEASAGRTVWE
jgi:hypothetical protein